MNWRLIIKDPKTQPKTGTYSDWKEQIAEECFRQCVYCSVNESIWGGINNYHIDHFRPKSLEKFKALIDDITNLYYACPICNRFKKDDWPNDPNLDVVSYIDPSITNYCDIFEPDDVSFEIKGKYIAAIYMINRLFLNRPQLIYERRESYLNNKQQEILDEITELAKQINDTKLLNRVIAVISALQTHLLNRDKIRPYKLSEIRKK